jgi:hypothetical protein
MRRLADDGVVLQHHAAADRRAAVDDDVCAHLRIAREVDPPAQDEPGPAAVRCGIGSQRTDPIRPARNLGILDSRLGRDPAEGYSPQRKPVALGAGSSGLAGSPSGTLGSL